MNANGLRWAFTSSTGPGIREFHQIHVHVELVERASIKSGGNRVAQRSFLAFTLQ
jgi:hypothetical protein